MSAGSPSVARASRVGRDGNALLGSCGRGDYALGALAVLVKLGCLTPEAMLASAVEAACHWDSGCRPPVHIASVGLAD